MCVQWFSFQLYLFLLFNGRRLTSLAISLAIEPPKGESQEAGKGDPCTVGYQEVGCCLVHRVESHSGSNYSDPEKKDVWKSLKTKQTCYPQRHNQHMTFANTSLVILCNTISGDYILLYNNSPCEALWILHTLATDRMQAKKSHQLNSMEVKKYWCPCPIQKKLCSIDRQRKQRSSLLHNQIGRHSHAQV